MGCDVNQLSGAYDLLLARYHADGTIRLRGPAVGREVTPNIVHQVKAGVNKHIDVVGLGQPKALRLTPAMITRAQRQHVALLARGEIADEILQIRKCVAIVGFPNQSLDLIAIAAEKITNRDLSDRGHRMAHVNSRHSRRNPAVLIAHAVPPGLMVKAHNDSNPADRP